MIIKKYTKNSPTIDRNTFVEQFKADRRIRNFVKKSIRIMETKRNLNKIQVNLNEFKLRSVIRNILREASSTSVPDRVPHESTGINVLEDLLKKIIPVLEKDFKSLTTDFSQRKSFRAHILHAVINSLSPDDANRMIDINEEIDINIDDPKDDPDFIDIDDDDGQEAEDPEEKFAVTGEDETGRNFAYQSWNKIEVSVLDAYETLSEDNDRQTFFDYLLTNLKLYFDKFEDELKINLEEPTTDEYEQEKEDKLNYDSAGDELDMEDPSGSPALDFDLDGEELGDLPPEEDDENVVTEI
tara:strand:- start:6143 stop:7036 length:894 start_codon:yes stop_codon:yes gene_type:complete